MLETPRQQESYSRGPQATGALRVSTVDGKTVPDAYLRRIELSHTDRLFCVKRGGQYQPITWQQAHESVQGVFYYLRQQGIQKGDRVCIMSGSCPEWMITDIATLCAGAVTVPIYHSSSLEDVAFILEHCGAKVVFAEDPAQASKLSSVFRNGTRPIPVVLFQGEDASLKTTAFNSLVPPPDTKALHETMRKSVASVQPSDIASIVYTSGTTGRPKGAVLTHANFAAELRCVIQEIEVRKDDMTLTFLPFAHILGRVESLMPIFAGITLGFAENVNTVAQNIQELHPTILVSVPRIYEKIFSKIQSEIEASPSLKRNIFRWAVGLGREVAQRRSRKQPIPPWLLVRFQVADRLVFTKIRQKLGGRIRMTVSGGAPLSRELCEFLHACGVKVLEGYGLTETTAAITVNRPDDYAFGTVGKPVPGMEIRIAPDGEIQARGPMVFREYYNNPEATAEVLSKDGWFSTGDIGEFDDRGFLKITDRKKELIVTSGGKKVAPQKLENRIKACRFFSNGMVYGDKQKYLVALITMNEPEVIRWAQEKGLPQKLEELAENPELLRIAEMEIANINRELASFESIKKFKLLTKDFTIDSGELTPSLKLKRKVVTERYRQLIDAMYA